MIPRSVKSPTIPIPFHRMLRVVAIVDAANPQTKLLLEHIAAENFEIEVTDRLERDVSEDASAGAAHGERYAGYALQQVCNEMHDFYRKANVKELQRLSFRASSFPELAMSPKDAYEALVANEVDYVPLEGINGRISATLALIYPPGIGVVVPGERWDDRARPRLDYFLAFQESFNRFPGFNYEVQGVFQEREQGRIRFYTYVVRE